MRGILRPVGHAWVRWAPRTPPCARWRAASNDVRGLWLRPDRGRLGMPWAHVSGRLLWRTTDAFRLPCACGKREHEKEASPATAQTMLGRFHQSKLASSHCQLTLPDRQSCKRAEFRATRRRACSALDCSRGEGQAASRKCTTRAQGPRPLSGLAAPLATGAGRGTACAVVGSWRP